MGYCPLVLWSDKRECLLNLWRHSVNLRRSKRARNERTTGPKRLDDTQCTTHKRRTTEPHDRTRSTDLRVEIHLDRDPWKVDSVHPFDDVCTEQWRKQGKLKENNLKMKTSHSTLGHKWNNQYQVLFQILHPDPKFSVEDRIWNGGAIAIHLGPPI